ncbi:X-ray repair cross-complementing protein 5-like [Homarus americanus]|uniref:X-ray repair cross-complementing protein 5-like n=1 Tax=Homarus americanus TaxID=6706 RepID=UPI001C49614B|nr:X-ray repair cross-complementing protein 5-like [Homarus americanus]
MGPRAKPGEGIVVVMDVGPGVRAGVGETFFSQSKTCLVNILQRKLFAEKCRDMVGIVLFGTNDTENRLAKANQYQHITVMKEPRFVDWQMIAEVDDLPRGNSPGDWLDALIVAMDLLQDPDDLQFCSKKIVLITDFSGEFSDDQSSKIISGLKNTGIDLSIIGPNMADVDDDEDMDEPGPSNGASKDKNRKGAVPQNWNGKPKSPVQLAGELLATRIVTEVDGISCSFDEAIPQLIFFQRTSASSMNWNTELEIGRELLIPITGLIKVKRQTIPTWKTKYAHDESEEILSEASYHRQDDAQTVVEAEEVIPGYKYGKTLVPVSDEDAKLKYSSNSPRCLTVLGLTKSSCVPHLMRAGDQVLVVIARPDEEAAAVALSVFIQLLEELDMVAITRRIYNTNSNPVMGALFPDITADYECLIWIPLPYQEDIRMFTFPTLQRYTGKFSDSDTKKMDDLISVMDLTSQEEDGEEDLVPTQVLNPQLQYFFNVLTHRTVHAYDPIPLPATHVVKILETPERLCDTRDRVASSFKTHFPTKQIVKKTKRGNQDMFASKDDFESNKKAKLDGDDNMSVGDLTLPLVTHVTSATPVQDFMALLGGEAPNFNLICKELGDVIIQLMDGLGNGGVGGSAAVMTKVMDCLTAFRRESIIIDPSTYNKFAPTFKDTVTYLSQHNLWDRVKESNLGMISSEENPRSNITTDAAEAFLQMDEPQQPVDQPQAVNDDDVEDLLDDL